MLRNSITIICLISATVSVYTGPLAGGQPASLYPAGIDPRACPNFPNCASPFVALSKGPPAVPAAPQPQQPLFQAQQYSVAPQQFAPASPQYSVAPQQFAATPQQYSAAPQEPELPPHIQAALNRGDYIGDGDYRGEGLAESQPPGAPATAPAAQYSAAAAPAHYGDAQAYSRAAAAPLYTASLQYGAVGSGAAAAGQYAAGGGAAGAAQYGAGGGVAGAAQYGSLPPQYAGAGVAPAPQAAPANIPAGLHPQACPNYPFCQ